jgi:competence protein ComEC
LLVVRGIAHASAASTWLALKVPLPGSWHLAVLAVACAGALLAPRTSRFAWLALGAIGLLSVELATIRAGNPRGVLRITTLDVGQGDATLVDLPDGRLMLIDGGGFVGSPVDPGRSVILPLLRARRRERVDIVVLSHPHPDHFGGLATTVAGVEVGEFWDSGQGESEGAGPVYAALLKTLRARNIPIVRPDALCRRLRHFASASLEVLGPCPRFVPGRDANDNSLVLRIEFGKHVVLLTGDAEQHQESELVAAHGRRLRADFLKVGHHGSRTSSTSDFLRHVQPQIATISCGVRNRFGHPHGVALERLSQAGVLALRLDRTGQVIWQSDGRLTSVRAFRLPR